MDTSVKSPLCLCECEILAAQQKKIHACACGEKCCGLPALRWVAIQNPVINFDINQTFQGISNFDKHGLTSLNIYYLDGNLL